ncbi:hypothetical protein [Chryseobacterium sp. T16E-39]|uniref:hypothetical protein n=1 Tax=Chryseobacterium sp. T16E-39 TaxID=2015076 RepID=UPI001E54A110|nr:hypothetical protein [Chryseobacterium sp. T16E-39]
MIDVKKYSRQTGSSAPKRVIKYTLFWCNSGRAEILIDENVFILEAAQTVTITSGQYHQLKSVEGELTALEFTLDFFCKNDSDIELIFHNGLFCHFGMNEMISVHQPSFFQKHLTSLKKRSAKNHISI